MILFFFFFFKKKQICNFAVDDTLYLFGKHLLRIKQNLVYDKKILLKWCKLNSLKLKPRKFVFVVLGDKTCCKYILDINSKFVEASDGVIFIDNLCWNA